MDAYLQRLLLILPVFLLILLTGFFVAAEFALVKIRATRIDELVARNAFGARKVQYALRHINEYLSATQLGITIATLILGNFGEHILEGILAPAIAFVPASIRSVSLKVLALLLIVVLEVVIGEMAPKTLAIQRAEKIILALIYPLDLFYKLFKPLIFLMNGMASVVLRPLGLRPSG